MRELRANAALQFAAICAHYDLRGAGVEAELAGLAAGFTCAPTRDRRLLASLNQRKTACWMRLEYVDGSLADSAALEWDGLFRHAALGRNTRHNMAYHVPLDLIRQRLSAVAPHAPSTLSRH